MTKPHKPKTAMNQKAPRNPKSKAPFHRVPAGPVPPNREAAQDSERQPDSNAKEHKQTSSALGARISRRAADRLRAGHLWVYSSDIEILQLGEGNEPALLQVADSRGLLLG